MRERHKKDVAIQLLQHKQGCVEESEEDVDLGGEIEKAKLVFTPHPSYRFQLSVCSKCAFSATRPGPRRVLSTSSSGLPQTEPVSPSAE